MSHDPFYHSLPELLRLQFLPSHMKLSSCSLLSFQTHFPFLLNQNASKDSSPFKEGQTVSVAIDLPKMSRTFVLFNVNRASGKLYSETVIFLSQAHESTTRR